MQAAKCGITRPAKVQQLADGGFVKAVKGIVDKLTTQKPQDAPLGSGLANQAKETLTTRKQVLDDAERKAVGLAHGGAVRHNMKPGGPIPGKSPTATADNIKIDATAGEFMLKKSAADALGPKVLNALNAVGDKSGAKPAKAKGRGAVRKMAMGGYVADEDKPGGAVFGLYPQMAGGKRTTYATDTALRSGVEATGPSSFRPALTPSAPAITANGPGMRLGASQDPRSAIAAPATQPVAVVATPAPSTTPTAVPAPAIATAPVMGQSAADAVAPASGAVRKIGNSYSGQNVSGDITINGKAPTRGGFVSGTGDGTFTYGGTGGGSGAGGGVSDQALYAARMAAAQRGDVEGIKASYAAQGQDFGPKVDPIQALLNNGKPMTVRKAAALAALQKQASDQKSGDEQRKLEREKFGLDAIGANLDNQGKAQLGALRQVLIDPKASEKQKAEAASSVRALLGKNDLPPVREFAVPGGQVVDAMGNVTTQPSRVYDPTTKQFISPPDQGAMPIASNPKALAIRNDKNMSTEQKRAALKQLGYQ